MRQLRRLNQLWSWLPAFRAVGESEHLPTAAKHLLVSASALSRSIRLLEDELEVELFERSPRGLKLTEDGKHLLAAVRNAMQTLDESVGVMRARKGNRRLTVATSTPFARELVLPALQFLGPQRPLLRIESVARAQVMDNVRSGLVDLALMSNPEPDPELLIEPLMRSETALYCGINHPLSQRSSITLAELQQYPFVAPPHGVEDGWPSEVRRNVRVELEQLALGIDACVEGDVLAVLPELAARRAYRTGLLRRLPVEIGAPFDIYTVRRPPTHEDSTLTRLVAALGQRARRVEQEARRKQRDDGDTLRLTALS
ncbi:MAG: LysR family transcriptional regulator [Myxococcota bacterium]